MPGEPTDLYIRSRRALIDAPQTVFEPDDHSDDPGTTRKARPLIAPSAQHPELAAVDSSILEESTERSDAHYPPVPRHRECQGRIRLDVDEVAAGGSVEMPASPLEHLAQLLASKAR